MTKKAGSTCGTYDDVAAEYYDRGLHPTAANFRDASQLLLEDWLTANALPDGLVVEVGAGRSLLVEIMQCRGIAVAGVLLTDGSAKMLANSQEWARAGVRLEVAEADDLPVEAQTVGLLVSVLGDPYNSPSFWREVSRVLSPDGVCFFTTPSNEWSETFRPTANEPAQFAEFELAEGSVYVPSLILSVDEQTSLVERSGLRVVDVHHVPLKEVPSKTLSPKLERPLDASDSVVTGYLIGR